MQLTPEQLAAERWTANPRRPELYVSNMGRVATQKDGNFRIRPFQTHCRTGHMVLRLRHITENVRRLVAETWIGPRPEGTEVFLKNGNKRDLRVDNLDYRTKSEATRERMAQGRFIPRAVVHAFISAEKHEAIRQDYQRLKSMTQVAKLHGVSLSSVSRIINQDTQAVDGIARKTKAIRLQEVRDLLANGNLSNKLLAKGLGMSVRGARKYRNMMEKEDARRETLLVETPSNSIGRAPAD